MTRCKAWNNSPPFPELCKAARQQNGVPLVWAKPSASDGYVNLGDALSPIMVSLLSGRPIVPVSSRSSTIRMAAVGTIGHALEGGTVAIWGSGASPYLNPLAKRAKIPYAVPANTNLRVYATRGPITRAQLGEHNAVGPPVFGDPVWMLPEFYPAPVTKTHDLGVIVHLSDLAERSLAAETKSELVRYRVPSDLAGHVKIINTITATDPKAIQARLDEILRCRRIVSTSLHGMVFAESYGIPCLYFAPRGNGRGLVGRPLDPNDGFDLRITDLYLGVGRREIPVYIQPRRKATDWEHVMTSIDKAWEPIAFDTTPLAETFPLPLAPIVAAVGETVFDDPLIRAIPHQHWTLRAKATHWLRSAIS